MSEPHGMATLAPPTPAKLGPKPKRQPRYHIVLLDDDDHTYDYVIELFMKLFGVGTQRAYLMAVELDTRKRVICDTTSFERAEFKRDQIHAYGADWRIDCCNGSMSATLEPAPE